jgi:hypothetical protein
MIKLTINYDRHQLILNADLGFGQLSWKWQSTNQDKTFKIFINTDKFGSDGSSEEESNVVQRYKI